METTFPRLLRQHANERPMAAAMREKEYGIWQTFTWSEMQHLAAEVAAALKDSALRAKLQATGGNPEASTPAELAERIRQITAKMRKVIQDAGITGD